MLEEYSKKRDFTRSSEPAPRPALGSGPLTFVIQKHAARRLHYDFRLELDGVLKSWALPNGPSLDPKVKRLAVMVEDHPLDYAAFEGVIPAGEYGAGEVIVWDKGVYSPDEEGHYYFDDRPRSEAILRQGLENGKLKIFLRGTKIQGSWALVRMAHRQKEWLLIKHQDDFASPAEAGALDSRSVVSGLNLEDLKLHPPSLPPSLMDLSGLAGARRSEFPTSLSPMLASLHNQPFSSPDWLFEPKLDGYRVIAQMHGNKVRLISRNGVDLTPHYPAVAEALQALSGIELALDGEIIGLDENNQPCFQCLQNSLKPVSSRSTASTQAPRVVYYVFDILYLAGYDLRGVPLWQRKELLEKVLKPSNFVRLVEAFTDGPALYQTALQLGLEGVVAKRRDSLYESGRRSNDWLKIKAVSSDEFVIGGFTRGEGNRTPTFGALLLGSYDDQGRLLFRGSVGTGFVENSLHEIRRRLDDLATEKRPFADPVPVKGAVTWVFPQLVAEVKYFEVTREGFLRMPVFLRLREDKPPAEVRLSSTGQHLISAEIPKSPDLLPSDELARQFAAASASETLAIDGHRIAFTNLDKPLWPPFDNSPAVPKRALLIYLAQVSPYLLPVLRDRPMTLTRYPGGIQGQHFYQKHLENLPDFVRIVSLTEQSSGTREYILCDNLPTLLWLGQMANIEFHSWFSRVVPDPSLQKKADFREGADYAADYPDFLVFDIDPYIYSGNEARDAEPELNRAAFGKTAEMALELKAVLDSLSLPSFIKTSGKTGLHVQVPVVRRFDFRAVRSAARTISEYLLARHPQELTVDWAVAKRSGKIFLDYNQNVRGKTLASAYSPRPTPQATVSSPLRWDELDRVYPTDFTLLSLPVRLTQVGDLWASILSRPADLSQLLKLDEE